MKKDLYKILSKNNSFFNILSFENKLDGLNHALQEVIITYCEMNPTQSIYDVDEHVQRALHRTGSDFRDRFESRFSEPEKWHRRKIGKGLLFDD